MELIKELHFVLTQQQAAVLEKIIPASSKLRLLYQLIVDHEVNNDEEAALRIYNSSRIDKKYLMLKRSLVHKLSDLVFKLSGSDSLLSNYETIRLIVAKELLIAEKMLNENVYHNPSKIIAKAEQLANQYFLIDLQLEAAIKLRSVYALKGYPAETALYQDKVNHLQVINQQLTDAKGFWDIIYSKTKFSNAKTQTLFVEAQSYHAKIEGWLKNNFNPYLKLYAIRIGLIANHQNNNFNSVFHLLTNYQLLLENYPFLAGKQTVLDLHHQFALYYRNVKQLEQALDQVNKCLQLSLYQAFNRFLIQEIHFDILLKMEAYHEALLLLNEVMLQAQFPFLDPYDKSVWALREAYLYFIFYATHKESPIQQLTNFAHGIDINRFLDQTKKSAKDKYGHNISLQLLLIKDPKRIEYEGNNLMVYFHRYMKALPDQRTLLFFKSLSKLAAQGFLPEQVKQTEENLLKELHQLDTHYDTNELIPYPVFWQLTKQLIQGN
jgi:hypothetical protein